MTKFYCYLLKSPSGGTYVGFTTNPKRRLRQHNGEIKGGARYTKRCSQWKMAYLVSGFKTKTHALRFEWAWKHPSRSRYLKKMKGRGTKNRIDLAFLLCQHPEFSRLKISALM